MDVHLVSYVRENDVKPLIKTTSNGCRVGDSEDIKVLINGFKSSQILEKLNVDIKKEEEEEKGMKRRKCCDNVKCADHNYDTEEKDGGACKKLKITETSHNFDAFHMDSKKCIETLEDTRSETRNEKCNDKSDLVDNTVSSSCDLSLEKETPTKVLPTEISANNIIPISGNTLQNTSVTKNTNRLIHKVANESTVTSSISNEDGAENNLPSKAVVNKFSRIINNSINFKNINSSKEKIVVLNYKKTFFNNLNNNSNNNSNNNNAGNFSIGNNINSSNNANNNKNYSCIIITNPTNNNALSPNAKNENQINKDSNQLNKSNNQSYNSIQQFPNIQYNNKTNAYNTAQQISNNTTQPTFNNNTNQQYNNKNATQKYNNTTQANDSHTCVVCFKSFQNIYRLNRHLISHQETKEMRKFQCLQCRKAFKFKHHLKEHSRIHSGEKPFHCTNCGKRFSHSGSYSSHMTSKKCWRSLLQGRLAAANGVLSESFNGNHTGTNDGVGDSAYNNVGHNSGGFNDTSVRSVQENAEERNFQNQSVYYKNKFSINSNNINTSNKFLPLINRYNTSDITITIPNKIITIEPTNLSINNNNVLKVNATNNTDTASSSTQDTITSLLQKGVSQMPKVFRLSRKSSTQPPLVKINTNQPSLNPSNPLPNDMNESKSFIDEKTCDGQKLENEKSAEGCSLDINLNILAAAAEKLRDEEIMNSKIKSRNNSDKNTSPNRSALNSSCDDDPSNQNGRIRSTISSEQRKILQEFYEKNPHPTKLELEVIRGIMPFPKRVVQVWFQNTRARDRRRARIMGAYGAHKSAGNKKNNSNDNKKLNDNNKNNNVKSVENNAGFKDEVDNMCNGDITADDLKTANNQQITYQALDLRVAKDGACEDDDDNTGGLVLDLTLRTHPAHDPHIDESSDISNDNNDNTD